MGADPATLSPPAYRGAGRPSLSGLAEALRQAALPQLSPVVTMLTAADDYTIFARLVLNYLPEHRDEVLHAGSPAEMVAAFARYFRERYFPLHPMLEWGDVESLGAVVYQALPGVDGMGDEDYHEISSQRLGVILASLLVDFEAGYDVDEGVRLTLVEAAANKVHHPGWLGLEKVAGKGYPLVSLQTLAGTPYEGVLLHGKMMCHATGNPFLDDTEEMLNDSGGIEWDREGIEEMTRLWAEACRIEDRMSGFYEWLEADPVARLSEVIDCMEGRAHDERQLSLGLAFDD